MAKLTNEDVLKLAKLSRLKLTDDEVSRFKREIEAILDYVEQLQSLELDEYLPTSQVSGLTNVMRDDIVSDYQATPDGLLELTPLPPSNRQIKVRRVK
jgi:aspartyl-tRNA(Asn)/glutamyl-tRNA(Gln) amidotransferase subunit C